MNTCIECGRRMSESESYYDGAAARAFIPIAGRFMSDGPFCSKGCKREYLAGKEAQADGKALKKEAKSLGLSTSSGGYDASDLKEQRRIMELLKEEREEEELRVRREKEEEETRQRQDKAALLRRDGHTTRAFLLHNQNGVVGAGVFYLFATFFASMSLSSRKGTLVGWVWVVAGLVLVGVGVWVVRRIMRESAAIKAGAQRPAAEPQPAGQQD